MERSQIEKISKALADETRLMIFEAISRKKQMNCGEIVSLQGVTPATVSHHLKILNEAGLIECRREGQFVTAARHPKWCSPTPAPSREWLVARWSRANAEFSAQSVGFL